MIVSVQILFGRAFEISLFSKHGLYVAPRPCTYVADETFGLHVGPEQVKQNLVPACGRHLVLLLWEKTYEVPK